MPSPRDIAVSKNPGYLVPDGDAHIAEEERKQPKERDYGAHPTNPPVPPLPAKNLTKR